MKKIALFPGSFSPFTNGHLHILKNTIEKLEILKGFSKATKDIKRVIVIIEGSENTAEAKIKLAWEARW